MVDVEIVERLAAEGLRVDRKHLNKILHNPFYCGKITHNLLGDEVVDGKQEIFRSISTSYKVEKEKAASEKSHLSPLVGIADEISNIKFIEDFDKIVTFILAT